VSTALEGKPAVLGGTPAVTVADDALFRWPLTGDDEVAAAERLIRKGELSISDETRELEREFAEYIGTRYALGTNNGTAAIHSSYFAMGVGPGDEVLAPTYTFWGSVQEIFWVGGIPVLCDCEEQTLGIDPADMERRITERTRAVVVVHLWGMPSKLDEVLAVARRHDLRVLEDCSHAHGATYKGRKVGSFGTVGAFSLQTSKLMTGGEGGILVTDDHDLLERATALAHHERIKGLSEKYSRYVRAPYGFKYRMHPVAAAIARVQLRRLDEMNAVRAANVARLAPRLERLGLETYTLGENVGRTYYEWVVRYRPERFAGVPVERFVGALNAEGARVSANRYPRLHDQPLFRELSRGGAELPPQLHHAADPDRYDPAGFPVANSLVDNLIRVPVATVPAGELMDQYAEAFEKVAGSADRL
jgi:dTDP-4-amino-4,6-dideoxygalactose transaminase